MNERDSRSLIAGTSWWSVGAVVFLVAAFVALLMNRAEAGFVLAALGALSWFLNVRHNLPRPDEVADEDQDSDADDEAMDDGAETGEIKR